MEAKPHRLAAPPATHGVILYNIYFHAATLSCLATASVVKHYLALLLLFHVQIYAIVPHVCLRTANQWLIHLNKREPAGNADTVSRQLNLL